MALHSRCGKCGGSKLQRGLGGMLVACETCKGVGFIAASDILACADDKPKRARRQSVTQAEAHTIPVTLETLAEVQ